MLNLRARNVNEALYLGVMNMKGPSVRRISPRGQTTLEYATPVTTTYINPTERVLFLPARDANPFFHFFESLWILAGRHDVAWLSQFNGRIASYSDNGVTFHGAYGHRLRYAMGRDQVKDAIGMLKSDPDTRQAVLQIWNCTTDLDRKTKDVPCNDLIFCKIRNGALNITVANRSNDMLWGAYGANVVQFSVLQEYMAAHIGCEVGEYRQVSDSYHVYVDGDGGAVWERVSGALNTLDDRYATGEVTPMPLVYDPHQWDFELRLFMDTVDPTEILFQEPLFAAVAVPALIAWWAYKKGDLTGALNAASDVAATDWQVAMVEWLERRKK